MGVRDFVTTDRKGTVQAYGMRWTFAGDAHELRAGWAVLQHCTASPIGGGSNGCAGAAENGERFARMRPAITRADPLELLCVICVKPWSASCF